MAKKATSSDGVKKGKSGGVTSAAMKAVGRNVARANNQKGKR